MAARGTRALDRLSASEDLASMRQDGALRRSAARVAALAACAEAIIEALRRRDDERSVAAGLA